MNKIRLALAEVFQSLFKFLLHNRWQTIHNCRVDKRLFLLPWVEHLLILFLLGVIDSQILIQSKSDFNIRRTGLRPVLI
ncbi:MAG: hypothetical protein DWI24_03400 [Planctomycetota bacterium]|nr:MAG: hypothetical protein DWI24_03400 [Planctomycetota bacterium]